MANTISDSAAVTDVSGSPQFARLETMYEFRDREEIINYLNKHAFLLDILEEAPAKIHTVFPAAPLALEYSPDYENPADARVVLWIKSTYGVDESLERMDKLDTLWWFKVVRNLPVQQKANLSINMEF
jgi:hypothetical protein